jgi:hypothetical protein
MLTGSSYRSIKQGTTNTTGELDEEILFKMGQDILASGKGMRWKERLVVRSCFFEWHFVYVDEQAGHLPHRLVEHSVEYVEKEGLNLDTDAHEKRMKEGSHWIQSRY